ncbi:transcriptional repressor [bacterium]|nr:transcriptional repressor [candidate division CSSED10-310 bacterium]
MEQRIAHFREVCRLAEVKLTHQRLEIFREVARAGDHPDAETIYRRVREHLPVVSLDTVYRTLWLLKDLGLVTALGSHHERARFDANLDHHHHFVCIDCGMTVDFYSDSFDRLEIPESVQSVGAVEVLQVEMRGRCHACAMKSERRKQENRR